MAVSAGLHTTWETSGKAVPRLQSASWCTRRDESLEMDEAVRQDGLGTTDKTVMGATNGHVSLSLETINRLVNTQLTIDTH